ncbi:hypothetical protein BEN47_15530 [Hymenobacter lapidarius]|uniref:DUF3828 domain-containing protein n=1 Tax=Hymenobacter lapidarius TaxID=1908237 RepID=A0A1G1T281_9BACT|nr:hypothetical protein [Hymenobacter lapidarius]OGX84968.1 hypothetical protein BEN47_15530 [Hymenobacter lapidarius]
MKQLQGPFLGAALLLTACSGPQEAKTDTRAPASPSPPAVSPSGSPAATVRAFLTWYLQHQAPLNSLPVVPARMDEDTTQVYAVDFHAVEDYVRLLQSSGTVSPIYLQAHRRYFQQCADSLRAHPQTDGFVNGLDYDHILYTQAGDIQTQIVLRSQPTRVTVGADTAQVVYRFTEQQMSEGPNLAFSLAVEQGRWMITAVRPLE